MHVTCFACDARIDGPDLAAIAEAFLAHGREAHDWTFPEAALRNYACNYAEASERVSDDVERRDTIGPIAIRPVTPANLADWQRFFDRVIADAPARGAAWIEAYPHLTPEDTDGGHFRWPRGMFEARGFERVADAERYAVLRWPVG